MAISFWQIAIVVVLFLLLFGRGRIPQLMGDLATGMKQFRQGLQEDTAEDGKDSRVELANEGTTRAGSPVTETPQHEKQA